MDKNFIVRPTGLKGDEQTNRMRELMNMTPINEGVNQSVVELTKKAPNGVVYGVVRENHEYYLKTTTKTKNITPKDFQYIGGLGNKKDYAFPSYAEATKRLNLKLISISESLGLKENIDTFRDDNLLSEANKPSYKSYGTVPYDKHVVDKKGEELEMDADEGENTGTNLVGKKGKKKAVNDFQKVGEVKLTENEQAIDDMISGKVKLKPVKKVVAPNSFVIEGNMKIGNAHKIIDEAISDATGETHLNEVTQATKLLKNMSREEVISILEKVTLKKKV